MNRSYIIGTGSALPVRIVTNRDLEKIVDTSDEWITTRTGIECRRVAGVGEDTSMLAAQAGREALAMAGVAAAEVDAILVATMTSDMGMPSTACLVQKELGARNAFAFDLNAACSGFLYALDIADGYIQRQPGMKVLVIGAETISARLNWQDRNTCVLFGDGAGACLLTGSDSGGGVLATKLFADGRLHELLYMDAAPGMNPALKNAANTNSYIQMTGRDVFKHAVRAMEDAVGQVLKAQNVAPEMVKLVIPHQANIRIIHSLAERLGVPLEKIFINIHKYGNTSAATVPIALDEANRQGRLVAGDLLLVCAFGGGFTWGASLIQW